MIKTVVREHHWSPEIVGDLFINGDDHESLEFWYDDCVQMNKELKDKEPK